MHYGDIKASRVWLWFVCCLLFACSDNQTHGIDSSPANDATTIDSSLQSDSLGTDDNLAYSGELAELRVSAQDGGLHFEWDEIDGRYDVRLMYANLIAREFYPIFETQGGLAREYTLAVDPLFFDWSRALFSLEACDETACLRSPAITVENLQSSLATKLTLEDSQADDRTGVSVALNHQANTLVVGAPATTAAQPTRPGSVVTYFRVGDHWWFDSRLHADSISNGAALGASVAINDAGDTIAAGAPNHQAQESGAVAVFQRLGEGWINTTNLFSDEPGTNHFGTTVKLSGDGNSLITTDAAGSGVWIYRQIDGDWQFIQKLKISEMSSVRSGVIDIAITGNGEKIFVGTGDNIAVFQLNSTSYLFAGQIWPDSKEDNQNARKFAISANGSSLLVSLSTKQPDSSTHNQAFFYEETLTGQWDKVKCFDIATNTATDYEISLSMSADGNAAAVALQAEGKGEVLTYSKQPYAPGKFSRWQPAATFTEVSGTPSGFASAVALSGDGKMVLVGAPLKVDGTRTTGAVYIY